MEYTMFPAIPSTVPAQAAEDIGRVPAFDPETNTFLTKDGALVERSGREAVRQWIDLMLRQQIDRVPIYRTDSEVKIGVDHDLSGSKRPTGLQNAETERYIRETMSYCPAIRTVQDFSMSRRGRACLVTFTAVLYTGETLEVSANV